MDIYDVNGNVIGSSLAKNVILTGNLPTIFITSATTYADVTKDTSSNGTLTFVDGAKKMKNVPIKFKLQGSGSLSYAKHNFNVTFYEDDARKTKQKFQFNNWMPTSKIHIKANEYDYSMVRNSVGTRIAHDLMGKYLPDGAEGYTDSFPVILYYNGECKGCHTWNLPQDGKTFAFSDSAETAGTNLAYRYGGPRYNWDTAWKDASNFEYRGDEDETESMHSVFVALHDIMVDYADLTTSIVEEHFDKQTLIAYWTLADIMLAVDSLINNWTLVTWDGEIWYHTWYDLDLIFGLGGNDGTNLSANKDITTCQQYTSNGFWQKIVALYSSDIASMYATMRQNGADADTLYNRLHEFQMKWGWRNISLERTTWASDKLNTNEISKTWIQNRLNYLDTKYGYSS